MSSLAVVPPAFRGVSTAANKGDVMRLADLLLQSVDIAYKITFIGLSVGVPVILKRLAKPVREFKHNVDVLREMAVQFDPANNEGMTLKETITQIKTDTEALVKQRESRITKVEEELKTLAQDRRDRVIVVDQRFDKQDKQIARIEELMHLQNRQFGIKEPSQLKEDDSVNGEDEGIV